MNCLVPVVTTLPWARVVQIAAVLRVGGVVFLPLCWWLPGGFLDTFAEKESLVVVVKTNADLLRQKGLI